MFEADGDLVLCFDANAFLGTGGKSFAGAAKVSAFVSPVVTWFVACLNQICKKSTDPSATTVGETATT